MHSSHRIHSSFAVPEHHSFPTLGARQEAAVARFSQLLLCGSFGILGQQFPTASTFIIFQMQLNLNWMLFNNIGQRPKVYTFQVLFSTV